MISLVLQREFPEIIRNTEQQHILNDAKRLSNNIVLMITGIFIVTICQFITADPNAGVWIPFFVSYRTINYRLQTIPSDPLQ